MKKLFTFLGLALLTVNLHSCAELAAGLSSYNQVNGTQCTRTQVSSAVWDDGEYHEGYSMTRDDNGNDIEHIEDQWLDRKGSGYLNYSFGVYYATSPHSGHEYRFTNYCASYY